MKPLRSKSTGLYVTWDSDAHAWAWTANIADAVDFFPEFLAHMSNRMGCELEIVNGK